MKEAAEKIEITELLTLPEENFISFIDALSSRNYEITDPGILPDNTVKHTFGGTSNKAAHYRLIFNDPDATLGYFMFKFPDKNGLFVEFPIAVFGKSATNKLYFPLVIDQTMVEEFLKLSKARLAEVINFLSPAEIDRVFVKFLEIKKHFIITIFQKYLEYSKDQLAVMVWDYKGEKSFTRTIAENLSFNYWENNDLKVEFFSSKPITEEEKKDMDQYLQRYKWVMSLSLDTEIKPKKAEQEASWFTEVIGSFYQRLLLHEAKA